MCKFTQPVTLLSQFWEVLVSNFGRSTNNFDWGCPLFSSFSQCRVWAKFQIRSWSLPSIFFTKSKFLSSSLRRCIVWFAGSVIKNTINKWINKQINLILSLHRLLDLISLCLQLKLYALLLSPKRPICLGNLISLALIKVAIRNNYYYYYY